VGRPAVSLAGSITRKLAPRPVGAATGGRSLGFSDLDRVAPGRDDGDTLRPVAVEDIAVDLVGDERPSVRQGRPRRNRAAGELARIGEHDDAARTAGRGVLHLSLRQGRLADAVDGVDGVDAEKGNVDHVAAEREICERSLETMAGACHPAAGDDDLDAGCGCEMERTIETSGDHGEPLGVPQQSSEFPAGGAGIEKDRAARRHQFDRAGSDRALGRVLNADAIAELALSKRRRGAGPAVGAGDRPGGVEVGEVAPHGGR